MSDNQQRAADLWNEGLCNSDVPGWSWRGMIAAALDAAEARGRAEVAEALGCPVDEGGPTCTLPAALCCMCRPTEEKAR